MINLHKILLTNYSEFQWSLRGQDYDGLEWLDKSPKPSKEELESQWETLEETIKAKEQSKVDARNSAFSKLAALGLTEEEVLALVNPDRV
jgi:YesN/AraC family two-component response regulator